MARNGSGQYIAPAGNPVVSGTVIQSSTFNTTIIDVGNELTNSLPRDGQAPMTAPLKIIDGTGAMPGVTFNAESSTGLFRPSTGNIAVSVSGIEVLRAGSSGRVLIGTTTDDTVNKLQVTGSAAVSGNVTGGGTGSFTSTVTAPTFQVAGGGYMTTNAYQGLLFNSKTGSSYDFALVNPPNSLYLMNVPTGTLNINFFGTVTAPTFSGALSGNAASSTTAATCSGNAATVTNGVYNTGGTYNINITGQSAGTPWAGVSSKPTTVGGYGISDALTLGGASLANQPASTPMTGQSSYGAFQAQAQGSGGAAGAAFMTFHRPGNYAILVGLDTDNQMKIGGWSMGSAHVIQHGANTLGSVEQTQNDVTGSRALGSTYTNSTGRTIFISICTGIISAGFTPLNLYTAGIVYQGTNLQGGDNFVCAPIKDGDSYSTNSANMNLVRWIELR